LDICADWRSRTARHLRRFLPTTLAAASESDGEIRQLVEVKLNVVRAEPAPLQIEGYSGASEAEPVVEVKEIKDQDE